MSSPQPNTRPRVALVTGAARGIGRGIVLRLAADGFDIALNDLPSSARELADVADVVAKLGRGTFCVHADVSNEDDVARMVHSVVAELGSLDVMVANAGIGLAGSVLDTSVEDLERIFAVNVRGVFLCYKYAAEQMIAQGRGGRIIGASSRAGKQGLGPVFAYSASKFAVRGMTQSAAADLAKHSITVNAYAPGSIETDLLRSISEAPTGGPWTIPNSPLGRFGTTDDVAALVSYLVSDGAGFVTGQTVSINGGIYFD